MATFQFKRLAAQALSTPPLWTVMRRRALNGDPVTILCYHTLGPDHGGPDSWTVLRTGDFLQQLATLRAHYDIVSLDEALEGLSNRASSRSGGAKRPRAVLTFDDGEAGMHRYLLPLVEREKLPVTVYVATGQIAKGKPFWFDRVMNACQTDSPQALDLMDEGLGRWQIPGHDGVCRWQVLGPLLEALKQVDPARREAVTQRIEAALPAPSPERMLAPMTQSQLAELAACPWVTIGAHTHCHNLLDQVSPAEARQTIRKSRLLLQDWTGKEVAHFAYPNGNYTPQLCREVEGSGFRSATILDMGLAHADDNRFALPRVAIGRYDSLARFRLRLAML